MKTLNCCKKLQVIMKSHKLQFLTRLSLIFLPLILILQDLFTQNRFQTLIMLIFNAIIIVIMILDLILIRLSVFKKEIITEQNIVDFILILIGYLILFFLLFEYESSIYSFLQPANIVFFSLVISKETVKFLFLVLQYRKLSYQRQIKKQQQQDNIQEAKKCFIIESSKQNSKLIEQQFLQEGIKNNQDGL